MQASWRRRANLFPVSRFDEDAVQSVDERSSIHFDGCRQKHQFELEPAMRGCARGPVAHAAARNGLSTVCPKQGRAPFAFAAFGSKFQLQTWVFIQRICKMLMVSECVQLPPGDLPRLQFWRLLSTSTRPSPRQLILMKSDFQMSLFEL